VIGAAVMVGRKRYCGLCLGIGTVSLSSDCVWRGDALALRGLGVPIRIYRAPAAAAVNDGRLALVDAVIVTVPTHHVAFVRHVAPMRISGLVGMAYPYVKAYSRRYRSRERQYENEDPHA
jgi:hypothetical protein